MDKEKILKWRFDVNTFRLLGRELITDRITALFELMKNSYDANSENVVVEFFNVGDEKYIDSKIIIKDNGDGMTFKELKNGWMVVGTNYKRIKKITDKPYYRKIIGEKGIGRFAVDKLGSKLTLKTKPLGSSVWFVLEVDWKKYEKLAEKTKEKYFTDIPNRMWYENSEKSTKGTELIITNVNELWTLEDIKRAYKELSKLISPFNNLSPPFNIELESNEYKDFESKFVNNESIKYASFDIHLTCDE